MKKIVFGLILVVVVAIVFAVFRSGGKQSSSESAAENQEQADGPKTGVRVGDLAPDFELATYKGEKVKLSDFRGKSPVFVNFWATWCPFCVAELPLMAKTQEKFGDKFVTLAINRGESKLTAREFTDELKLGDKLVFLEDKSDATYGRYKGFAMPYSLFIDKNGIIKDVKLGPLGESEVESKIQAIIN